MLLREPDPLAPDLLERLFLSLIVQLLQEGFLLELEAFSIDLEVLHHPHNLVKQNEHLVAVPGHLDLQVVETASEAILQASHRSIIRLALESLVGQRDVEAGQLFRLKARPNQRAIRLLSADDHLPVRVRRRSLLGKLEDKARFRDFPPVVLLVPDAGANGLLDQKWTLQGRGGTTLANELEVLRDVGIWTRVGELLLRCGRFVRLRMYLSAAKRRSDSVAE